MDTGWASSYSRSSMHLRIAALFVLCFVAPELLAVGLDYLFAPVGACFLSMGYRSQDFDAPHFQFFVIPLIAATLLSGLALLLGFMIGWLTNRFEMVVTVRHGSGVSPRESIADSVETA